MPRKVCAIRGIEERYICIQFKAIGIGRKKKQLVWLVLVSFFSLTITI